MKKQRFCVILVVLGALLFNGCVSWRWDAEIELDSNQRIETLQFYDHLSRTATAAATAARNKIGPNLNKSLSRYGSVESGYICFEDTASYEEDYPILDLTCAGLQGIVGLPTDYSYLTANVKVFIFDSNGNLVKVLADSATKKAVAGWYYGQNPNGYEVTQEALNKIINNIGLYSEEINRQLQMAGPITYDKQFDARKKIDEYFAQNKKSSSSPSYSPIPTTPTTTTPAPATTTTTNTTLKYGKYTCSGANYYMNLTGYGNSGTITLNLNSGLHPMLASGSFKIQNNRIIITLSYVDSRYVSWPSGTSFSYNISDDKCFQAGNEVWFYSGY